MTASALTPLRVTPHWPSQRARPRLGALATLLLACAATAAGGSFTRPALAQRARIAPAPSEGQLGKVPQSDKAAKDAVVHGSPSNGSARAEAQARRERLAQTVTWAIQLRFLNQASVVNSPYDLIVMDYAPDANKDPTRTHTRAEVEALKQKSDGGRRLVLAYLSIGEAERYRPYWRAAWDDALGQRPAWLLAENPAWPGNYRVRYANPEWQALIFGTPESYLDRILEAGFDGVYLDRVDAFQDEGQDNGPPAEAEDTMLRFVTRICDHARRIDPKFIVVMQNAEELLQHATLRQRLDGIAKEDLAFGADNSTNANPADWVQDSLRYLRRARKAGLTVLTIEYVKEAASVEAVKKLNAREGFRLYLADRLLDSLKPQGPVSEPAGAAQPAP